MNCFHQRKLIYYLASGFFCFILLTSIVLSRLVKGRAIAQAVSRWLPTAAARVGAQVCQVGFVVN
jgi:hypothetical protein